MISPTTKNVKKIRGSGLSKVASFPPMLIASELVIVCRECYHSSWKIIDHDGRVLADFSTRSIGQTFHIPTFNVMEETEKGYAENMWKVDSLAWKKLINQHWLKEKRRSATKVPQELFRSDFYEEYHNLVTLLSMIMGLPVATFFEEMMFYFIEEIIWGETKF